MKDVIALLNCHNSPELGELTSSRPLASTSFLGRYAFADFALSNFCNSEIDTVGILVKDHQRSILKHMGNMMSWVNNTKTGRETIFYNEKGQLNPAYNSDLNNIRENDWVLYDSDASYIVFESAHIVLDIDLRPIIEEHIARHEDITLVYKKIDDADKEFVGGNAFTIDEDGYLLSIDKNDGKNKKANISLEIWIINRTVLADIIARHAMVDASFGMIQMIEYLSKNKIVKIHTHEFKGYARSFDSLKHYVDYSFELLDRNVAKELFKPEWPIYTLTHDTPPALFGDKSNVSNSFIANGCLVEGEVKNSIICRNVKIGKGAKINRSIILSNVSIGAMVTLSDVVIDKYSIVTQRHTIAGDPENVIYLKQGAIL
ncbi:MAG: glucose-1-phosphate adenylyltransferase subunit GlgD [Bacilli bacterium]|jgi:glucose-1-phosphate adenylyltransferase|nr:glucose-1-phosphate adenylyltransferase subunit GlgD [Bacilli bacterium]MCH4210872.1 glucose-1-phosphate adenylyltransferase subunit GlgD [Bacilli bacterium]MCH4228388.1 glucose-1-phosphate adenylyltransferase subunit GlgD [Bacilli bacterium]MCH4277925.1 glucose-1-phosphate adenylyltransferase subunit GlgD [Bacilli bacterium]MCI2054887.1 glucose-1-phosphate adenylyltransferase subunit GlgD [Bacilli bacterium]